MYAAIYRCKMCGREFPYVSVVDFSNRNKTDIQDILDPEKYTPYGARFPESRLSDSSATDPPERIPHYCESGKSFNDDSVGIAELIGFKEMVKKKGKVMFINALEGRTTSVSVLDDDMK